MIYKSVCFFFFFITQQISVGAHLRETSMTHTWCKYGSTCMKPGCVCVSDHPFMTARLQAASSLEQNNKKTCVDNGPRAKPVK